MLCNQNPVGTQTNAFRTRSLFVQCWVGGEFYLRTLQVSVNFVKWSLYDH